MSAAESAIARRIAVVRVFMSLACSSAPVNERCSLATLSWILDRGRRARAGVSVTPGSAETVIVCASPSAVIVPPTRRDSDAR